LQSIYYFLDNRLYQAKPRLAKIAKQQKKTKLQNKYSYTKIQFNNVMLPYAEKDTNSRYASTVSQQYTPCQEKKWNHSVFASNFVKC